MAHNVILGVAAANAETAAIGALCNSGYLRLYDGSQPATADTAVTDQTLIAELRFPSTALSNVTSGSGGFNALTADSSANATGTPTWFRALKSDGTSTVFDGTVGVGGEYDCSIDSVPVSAGGTVSVTSMTYIAHRG